MIKIYENGFMGTLEVSAEGIEGINELIFSKNDEQNIKSIFKDCTFKYRQIDDYIFNDLEFYKIYISYDDVFNVVRLTAGELEHYREMLKVSKILLEKLTFDEIYSYDHINLGYSPELKIIFEDERYLFSECIYEDENIHEKIMYITVKESESIGYDYKEYHIDSEIDKKLAGIQLDGAIEKKIRKYLRKNFDDICRKVGGFNFKVKDIFNSDEKSVEEFAALATANTSWLEHSRAGEVGNEVDFELIHGNIEFGINSSSTYSENGDVSSPSLRFEKVNFNKEESIVFMREDYEHDSYNHRNGGSECSYEYTLVIYKGV